MHDRRAVVLSYGGVVWERDPRGNVRVVVVHRPRYDDWSFPKGKPEKGEAPVTTAVREVEEETGLLCDVGKRLGEVRYPVGGAGTKVVGYWMMHPRVWRVRPPDGEVDAVAWWTVENADRRLTHDQDRKLLDRLGVTAG